MILSKELIRQEITGIAVLFAGSFLISFLFNGTEIFSSFQRFLSLWSYGVVFGLCFWKGNVFIARKGGSRLDWRKNAEKANSVTILFLLLYGLIISLAVPYVYYKYVFGISEEKLFGHVLGGSFIGLTINFAILSIYYSKFLARYWMKSIENEEKLKQENLVSKYEALKNQVNPHFLFNSLNTLSGLVEKDSEQAVLYIKKLSDIYRYVLEQKDKAAVNISEEIGFVNDYVYLQKIRYGDGFVFKAVIHDLKGQVAPLALQMLVENAVKHNIIDRDQPLTIELSEEEGFYVVKNNLQRKKTLQQNSPTGLDNLYKRYEFLSMEKVEITENENEFIVKLPKIRNTP
jgi:sensor histidine kinase YesM